MTAEIDIKAAASRVTLLLMDCDGVLTDGRIYFTPRGEEMKVFNVRDGQGLALWHRAGYRSGIISGRDANEILKLRADELGTEFVRTGSRNKVRDMEEIAALAGVSPEECAFLGDDIGDIDVMRRVGFGVAVRDAAEGAREAAKYVTRAKGGKGAVREVVELLLEAGA